MNNTEQYIHNIWTIMPMHTDKEKFYLLDLKKHLKEFMDDHPDCSYEDIVEHFGEPKDIVVEYIQNVSFVHYLRYGLVFFGMMSIEIQNIQV